MGPILIRPHRTLTLRFDFNFYQGSGGKHIDRIDDRQPGQRCRRRAWGNQHCTKVKCTELIHCGLDQLLPFLECSCSYLCMFPDSPFLICDVMLIRKGRVRRNL